MDKFILNSYQKDFVDSQEQYVGYFGGVGNGKTSIACMKIIELATQSPNNLCLVGRLTYPELRDSTKEVFMSTLGKFYPPEAYTHNKSENSVTFWNNSTVIFRHLDDQGALLGPNLGGFYIDQAEEVDEECFLTLQSRLRRPNVKNLKGLITGNPKGHNWVYYRFGMDKATGATNYTKDQYHRMITAPTHANIDNLPANYIDQLKSSYSAEWFNRYVLGGWDVFDGQIFDIGTISGYEELPTIKAVFTAIDPAISKSKDACNTAICTLGVGANGHIYDLETLANKWSFLETLEELNKVVSRQKPSYIGIEDVAYQRALFEACFRDYPNIHVIDLKADKDKFRRAKSVSHIVAKGLFHTNNRDLLNELTAFHPDQAGKERKDRVDALVHALHMVQSYAPVSVVEVSPHDRFKGLDSSQVWFKQTREHARSTHNKNEEVFSPSDRPVDPEFY